MSFTQLDVKVKQTYEKVMIIRKQEISTDEERLKRLAETDFWPTCYPRTERLVNQALILMQSEKISKKEVDDITRGVSDYLTVLVMYTDPAVMNVLTNEAIKKRFVEKMK